MAPDAINIMQLKVLNLLNRDLLLLKWQTHNIQIHYTTAVLGSCSQHKIGIFETIQYMKSAEHENFMTRMAKC